MGQKMHPVGFRLGLTHTHRSLWFCKKAKDYVQGMIEDHQMRQYIYNRFPEYLFPRIDIHKREQVIKGNEAMNWPKTKKVFIPIRAELSILADELPEDFCRVNVKISGPEKLLTPRRFKNQKFCHEITTYILSIKDLLMQNETTLQVREIRTTRFKRDHINPYLLNHKIISKLEGRKPYRRAVKEALWEAYDYRKKPHPLGMKVQISGRLDGAEMARTEWFLKGFLPLQTLRARIEYSSDTAHTLYGSVGLKIWIWHPYNQAISNEYFSLKKHFGFPRNNIWRRRVKRHFVRKAGHFMYMAKNYAHLEKLWFAKMSPNPVERYCRKR